METSKPFENNNEVDEEQEFDEEEPSWIELEYRARTSNNAEQIGYSFLKVITIKAPFMWEVFKMIIYLDLEMKL